MKLWTSDLPPVLFPFVFICFEFLVCILLIYPCNMNLLGEYIDFVSLSVYPSAHHLLLQSFVLNFFDCVCLGSGKGVYMSHADLL